MITRFIILLNVIAFAWEILVTHGAAIMGVPNQTPVDNFLLVPSFVLVDHEYYRMITAGFLHGSVLHIFMNMLFLYSVGRFIEAALGPARTAIVYALSLVISSACVVMFSAPNVGTLGASGAIFGMFGALFAIGLKLGDRGRQLVRANLGILIFNLIWSFAVPFISWQAHVGGLIAGFASAFVLFWPPRPVVAQAVDVHSGAQYESTLEEPGDDRQSY